MQGHNQHAEPAQRPHRLRRGAMHAMGAIRGKVAAGIGVAVALALLTASALHNQPKNFALVDAGGPEHGDEIYRSGELTPAAMRSVVERYGIRTVVDLRGFSPSDRTNLPPGTHLHGDDEGDDAFAQRITDSLGIMRINPEHGSATAPGLWGDGTGDSRNYVDALAAIRDAERPVLVHCAAGAQRTGVCIAMYRLLLDEDHEGGIEAALDEARRYGYDPDRDEPLEPYLREHLDAVAGALGAPPSPDDPADADDADDE